MTRRRRPPCTVPDCSRPFYARDCCRPHYERLTRYGNTFPSVRIVRGARFNPGTPSYNQAHAAVRADRGPATDHACVTCGNPATDWCYDHSDPNELYELTHGSPYSADPARYIARCRSCHRKEDHQNRLTRANTAH